MYTPSAGNPDAPPELEDAPLLAPAVELEGWKDEPAANEEDVAASDEDVPAALELATALEDMTPEDDGATVEDDEDTVEEEGGGWLVAATDEDGARELLWGWAVLDENARLVAAPEVPADDDTPRVDEPPVLLDEEPPASGSPVLVVHAKPHRTTKPQPMIERMKPPRASMGQNRAAGQYPTPAFPRRVESCSNVTLRWRA